MGVPLLLGFVSYAPPRYFVALVPAQILMVAYWLGRSKIDTYSQAKDWMVTSVSTAVLAVALFILLWAVANLILPLVPIPQGDTPGISAPTAVKLLLPTAAGLAVFVQLLYLSPKVTRMQLFRPVIYSLLVTAIAAGVHQASAVWLHPDYLSHAIRTRLVQTVSPGEAVAGDFAPFFALGTQIPAIYSTTNKNNGKVILDICPSYYLYSGTRHDDYAIESFQSNAGVRLGEPIALGEYAGRSVTLHRLQYPEGACK
jgi:hypothetical protein